MGRRSRLCGSVNKGPWSPDEDLLLTKFIEAHGEGRWRTLPQKAGLKRCGKSCRLRWKNYLRPSVKRGHISPDEEELIIRLHKLLGNRWSLIAGRVPGRTDNQIKNYWNTHLSKKATDECNNRLKTVGKRAVRPNAIASAGSPSTSDNAVSTQRHRSGNNGNSVNNHNAMDSAPDLPVTSTTNIKEEAITLCSDEERVASNSLTEELSNPSEFHSDTGVPANFNVNLQFNAAIKPEQSSIIPNHGISASASVINSSGPHDIEYQTYFHQSRLPVFWTELVVSDANERMASDLLNVPQGVLDYNYMQYYSEQDYGINYASDMWLL